MAKDPAFLFYSSDFLVGTMLLSNEEVGQYIRILCLLHQHKGCLSKKELEQGVGAISEKVLKKLELTKHGYQNKRLTEEVLKRSNYCKGRKQNLLGKKKKKPICTPHMESHMENENEDVNRDRDIPISRRFKKPTKEELLSFLKDNKLSVDVNRFLNHYESNGWKVGKNSMKNWQATIRNWAKNSFDNNTQQPTPRRRETNATDIVKKLKSEGTEIFKGTK